MKYSLLCVALASVASASPLVARTEAGELEARNQPGNPRVGGGFRGFPFRNNGNNGKNPNNNNNGGKNGTTTTTNNNNNKGNTNNNAAGAAFFITNEPNENQIVMSEFGQDGKLSFTKAISAGGKGAHGVTSPNGPDGLFSQGSVKVAGNFLYTVNPGSNTASMFKIDLNGKDKISMVGTPVSTEGEFPVSVAVSKGTNQVCVLNGGVVNGVSCYQPDDEIGLVAVPNTVRSLNLNLSTPAKGPAGTVSHVVFSDDGSKLIASVKGVPPKPGFLATWDVSCGDGSLSENFTTSAPGKGGLLPFSMTVLPGTDALLNTDAGIGFSVFNFAGKDTATSSVVEIKGQKATCWSTLSKKTGNLYLTDIGTSTVTEVNVDKNLKGTVVKQYPQANNSATIDNDIAALKNNDFLYVLAAGATSIDVLALNAPGKAQNIQTFNFANDCKKNNVQINPNNVQGMSVFVA